METNSCGSTNHQDELELLYQSFLFYSNCYDLRYQYGHGSRPYSLPNIMNYLPKTTNEWLIHYFNMNKIDLVVTNISMKLYDWILNNSPQLNSLNVVNYLTENEERSQILSLIATKYNEEYRDNYIECLRAYLLTSGAIALIQSPMNDEMNQKLQKILEIFASSLLLTHQTSYSTNQHEMLYELSQCILTLNEAILTGQESYSLPMFFETIRKITSQKLQIFSARELSSLYNTLRANGPFVLPPRQSLSNFYLLSSPIFTTTCSVLFHHQNTSRSLHTFTHSSGSRVDSIYQQRLLYLTPRAIYLDSPSETSNPSMTMECVPLEYMQFLRSEKDDYICELHPIENRSCLSIEYLYPLNLVFKNIHKSHEPQICLSFYKYILFKFDPTPSSELYFHQLEDCIWKIRCENECL